MDHGAQQLSPTPRAAALTLATLLAVTALGGCNGLSAQQKTLPSAQLKDELLTAPVGSKPYSRGTLAPGGVLNLDQFVDGVFTAKDQASEKTTAGRQGFKYAVETNWEATDGSSADVYLIQFSGSGGAQDFVSRVSEGTSEDETPIEPLSSVPGVPEGEALTAGAVDSVGNIRQIAWFSVGNIAVDLHYYTPGTADAAGLARLAQAQYTRVTSGLTTPSALPSPSGLAPAATSTAPAAAAPADQQRLLSDLTTAPGGSSRGRPPVTTGRRAC